MKTQYTYKFGNYFPVKIIVFALLFMLYGFYLINSDFIGVGCFLIIGSFLIATTKYGVEIIKENSSKKYRTYYTYFGVKTGKWTSIENYPYIAILNKKMSYNMSSLGAKSLKFTEEFYEIYLLNQTHRHKLLIKSSSDLEEISNGIKKIAQDLNVEYVQYSPVVSEKTAARRRNR